LSLSRDWLEPREPELLLLRELDPELRLPPRLEELPRSLSPRCELPLLPELLEPPHPRLSSSLNCDPPLRLRPEFPPCDELRREEELESLRSCEREPELPLRPCERPLEPPLPLLLRPCDRDPVLPLLRRPLD
jgi:hypothetical protein